MEDRELYRVGLGPTNQPFAFWEVSEPNLSIDPAQIAQLASSYPAANFWVVQLGTNAASLPLHLGNLA